MNTNTILAPHRKLRSNWPSEALRTPSRRKMAPSVSRLRGGVELESRYVEPKRDLRLAKMVRLARIKTEALRNRRAEGARRLEVMGDVRAKNITKEGVKLVISRTPKGHFKPAERLF